MSSTTPPGGYPVAQPSGSTPARPGTVTIASSLLYLLAALQVVSIGLILYTATFYDADKIEQIYLDNGATPDVAATSATATSVSVYFGAAVALIFAVVYLILGIFVGKGKQWARITTWVWAGLVGVCCGITGLILSGLGNALSGMGGNTAGIDQAAIQEEIAKLVPGWLTTVSTVLTVISLLAALTVIVLLALPPSTPFFRKRETEWTPPAYPTQ